MIHKVVYSKAPSFGYVGWNSDDDIRGYINQIVINPSLATTSFDFTVVDEENNEIYRKNNTGLFVDDCQVAVFGRYTFNLSNTSTNDSFSVSLIWTEKFLT